MPSNAENLLQKPVPWVVDGQTYQLGHTDIDVELMFQTIHEAWSRNRIEAMANKISPRAYQEEIESFGERRDGNRFAFGTRISASFIASAEGSFEYVLLKLFRGEREVAGTPTISREKLQTVRKSFPKEWTDMLRGVLERDLPLWFVQEPKPSTSTSTSSSPASPGSSPENKSTS